MSPSTFTIARAKTSANCCQQCLKQYQKEGNAYLSHLVASDETWVHHFTPLSKQASLTWKHFGSSRETKVQLQQSANNAMMTLFFDTVGPILVEYLPHGVTVNADRYWNALMQLHINLKNCRLGKMSVKPILLHDHAWPHSAERSANLLKLF